MNAVVLAGGLEGGGTEGASRAMEDVHGRPFLEYIVDYLRFQTIDEIVICLADQGDEVREYFEEGERWDVALRYIVDEDGSLGSAGAVREAADMIRGAFLVVDAAYYLDANLQELMVHHAGHKSRDWDTMATIAIANIDDAGEFPVVERDTKGRIVGFGSPQPASDGSWWVSTGVYVFQPEILELIPDDGPSEVQDDLFPAVLEDGRRLYGFPVKGFLADVRTDEGIERLVQEMEDKQRSGVAPV